LKASNFTCEGEAGGTHWTGKRDKGQNIPHEMKIRWRVTATDTDEKNCQLPKLPRFYMLYIEKKK
jgi:hypothetical protein